SGCIRSSSEEPVLVQTCAALICYTETMCVWRVRLILTKFFRLLNQIFDCMLLSRRVAACSCMQEWLAGREGRLSFREGASAENPPWWLSWLRQGQPTTQTSMRSSIHAEEFIHF